MTKNINLKIHFTLQGKYLLKLSIKNGRNSRGKFRVIALGKQYISLRKKCSYLELLSPNAGKSGPEQLTSKANSNFSGEEGRGGKYQSVVAILLHFSG